LAKKTKATAAGAAATKLAVAATAAGTQARSQASDLGERLAPVVGDAKDRLAPVVDDARERLVELTGTVAERIDDLTGSVASRLDDALPDRVTPAAVSRRAAKSHPNRFLQALFVLGLGAVAAAVTHRFTGGASQSDAVWRSAADQPTPAGAPATAGTTSTSAEAAGAAAAAAAGESAHGLIAGNDHASGNVPGNVTNDAGEVGPVQTSVDVAGGTPEEMAADATDTPHPVTTPDQPAQKVVLD
jgi:hypothetical protein